MKKIYIIAIVSAAICGILLYSFFSGYEKKTTEVPEKSEQRTEQVVVATQDIPAYSELKREMLKVVSVPEGSSHKNAVHTIEEAVGKITEREIASEEQILSNKIYETGDSGTSLSYQIPKGMRAMTTTVTLEQDVAGYLEEGDLIDLIATVPPEKGNTVVLSAVKILRLGEVTARGSGQVNSNITLLLTPKQCITWAELKTKSVSGFFVALREKTDKSN